MLEKGTEIFERKL